MIARTNDEQIGTMSPVAAELREIQYWISKAHRDETLNRAIEIIEGNSRSADDTCDRLEKRDDALIGMSLPEIVVKHFGYIATDSMLYDVVCNLIADLELRESIIKARCSNG